MDKWTVARTLDEIANYLELGEANRFKARAFERAARALEKLETDIVALVESGDLYQTPGIGKAIGPIVTEIVKTGRTGYLEELRKQYPPGIFDLMRVPSLGLKKIGLLHDKLGVASLDELEEACRNGKLAALKGFGPKTQEKILQGIEFARRNESRFLLPIGIETGESIRERLAAIDEIEDAEVAGSVRRRLEVIRNVNIVVATSKKARVIDALRRAGIVDQLEEIDARTWKGRVRGEIDVKFHIAAPADFGAALLCATGSAEFLEGLRRLMAGDGYTLEDCRLRRNGKPVAAASEKELFATISIAPVDPERREDASELSRKKRPRLVQLTDLRGTFHIHTTYSDGRNSVAEMLDAARERGFQYAGLSDHSKAAFYAGGLSEDQLRLQHAEIDRHRQAVSPMRVFRGTEADILADGSIDYGEKTLAIFDFVIASVHSNFKMPRDQMTERILTALDNPFVTFIGHLTGRLLLSREGYSVDYDRIFEKAAARGVMIEINGNPRRLDVDWRHIGRAVERGVVFSIHPDAHSIREYNALISGTWVARKGGLSAKQIFNTRDVDEVAEHLASRRK